ncbi:ComF family protein [Cupriavidus sp. UYPR2.512]|uniref:ComF family protein n=1 Tax=Cupriavidus sp. UYPR2.512 TaxID=1080187 RepID=UPI00035FA92F|nr:hypothetical protein [Cupriavidus sp. UYPR2.512]UIF86086.1 hypothetical protein KAF44_19030 [Cupriavidus necator]
MGFIQPINHLIDYHTYWTQDEYGNRILNPNFTRECGQILDLKKETEKGHAKAVVDFAQRLEVMLKAHNIPPLDLQVHIVLVPSSSRGQWSPGLLKIGDYLCRRNRNFVDSMTTLERVQAIQKLAKGGARNIDVHRQSIAVRNQARIAKKTVLLLDDVATTGNSFNACSQLLDTSGTALVMPLAIARTV